MQKYLITSPEFYTRDAEKFAQILKKQIQKYRPEYILFRDKEAQNYESLAKVFVLVCKEFQGLQYFLHSNASLAKNFGATGVHLTSVQFEQIKYAKSLNLETIVSTHTYKEALKVQNLGADYITYSPIFETPNKGEPKGVEDLLGLLNKTSVRVFALGGIINDKQVQKLSLTNVYGFASIRYFE